MKRLFLSFIIILALAGQSFGFGFGGGGGGVPRWKIGETVGVWSGAETYAKGKVVAHEGSGYISAQDDNLNHEPGEAGSETWWGLVTGNWYFNTTTKTFTVVL